MLLFVSPPLVYGVSEPLWHQSSHWYANAGYHTQDEVDQMALVLTVVSSTLLGKAKPMFYRIPENFHSHIDVFLWQLFILVNRIIGQLRDG